MSMFGARMGSWWVRSESDPRWNASGRAGGTVVDGGPKEMRDWIERCRKEYGEPPADAEHGFMKD